MDIPDLTTGVPDYLETGEVPNARRAAWALDAIDGFAVETFSTPFADLHPEDASDCIADLICDLLHLAHILGFDTDKIARQGVGNFKEELVIT